MILQGVLDRSLGNFVCLRGYARLGDLYQISAPDPSYQRDLISHQQERMEKFLDDGEFLFFPEVILGTSLNNGNLTATVNDFLSQFDSGKGATYSFSAFDLKYSVTTRKSTEESRKTILYRRATLNIKDILGGVNFINKFHRIDGNHRLSILSDDLEDKLTPEKIRRYKDLNVPFCLVLFNDNENLQRFSRALFHNVNYRQIALTMEQSLKQILEDTELFSDDTLLNKFGVEYLLARKVLSSLGEMKMIPNIAKVVNSEDDKLVTKRTFLLKTFEGLVKKQLIIPDENKIDLEAGKFQEQLSIINAEYKHPNLGKQCNSGLLSAFLHYAYQDDAKLNVFKNWVLENHIYQMKDTQAKEIIKIFDCVLEARKRTIFVSMQFSANTKANYKAIKDAVEDVNQAHNLYINLRDIRIDQFNTGYSYQINDEILKLIEDSGYFIADLTCGNKNVYHEIGYLMGLNQGKNLPQKNFILIHNDGIGDSKTDIGFNLSGIKQLRVDDTNGLREQIKQQIEIFYELKTPEV